MTNALALLLLLAAIALVTASLWQRRQRRRLLSSRETAHQLRQAQHIQALALAAQRYCGDIEITRVLLQLAAAAVARLATTEPGVQATATEIETLLERLKTATDDNTVEPAQAAAEDNEMARARLQLTDAARLLHTACRKGLIDSATRDRMSAQLHAARLRAEISSLLQQEAEARSARDFGRARSCLSQARKLLDNGDHPEHEILLARIEQCQASLDRGASMRHAGDG